MSGRALPPVTTVAPLATASSTCDGHPVAVVDRDQRAELRPEVVRRRDLQRLGRRDELVLELVVERRRAGRSARCACRSGRCCRRRRTARPARPRRRSASGEHDHRVLAAELEAAADQVAAGALADDAAGRGRAGEHDVVGVVDQRRPDVGALAADDLEQALRQPGLLEQRDAVERRQRGLVVGLEHDRRCRPSAPGSRRRGRSRTGSSTAR